MTLTKASHLQEYYQFKHCEPQDNAVNLQTIRIKCLITSTQSDNVDIYGINQPINMKA